MDGGRVLMAAAITAGPATAAMAATIWRVHCLAPHALAPGAAGSGGRLLSALRAPASLSATAQQAAGPLSRRRRWPPHIWRLA
jgi:hypothetical protein